MSAERPPSLDPSDLAAYAASLVTGDRHDHYGAPLDDFSRAALIWQAILGCDVTAEQVALCMVGVKIAREVHSHKIDNAVDGIGYWLTYAMVVEERSRRDRAVTPAAP